MVSGNSLADDRLLISDALFARLVRSGPREARALTDALPELVRARLALFYQSRRHFRDLGHIIASGCSEAMLRQEGGQAGEVLFKEAKAIAAEFGEIAPSTRPAYGSVSLARHSQEEAHSPKASLAR